MKKFALILGILVLITSFVYALGERPAKIEEVSNNVEVVKLKVEGIYCPSCIPTIRNALQKVPGVKKAEVNLQGEAKIYTEKDKANPASLIQAVEKAGYKATLAK